MMGALLLLLLTVEPDPRPAVEWHHACQRERRLSACPEGLAAYRVYLLRAPGDSTMRFYFAELLWSADRFADAAVEYRRVALDSECRYAKNAAFNAVLAREKLIGKPRSLLRDGKPWPLDVARQDLVDAADFYLSRYPDTDDAPAIAHVAANLYLEVHDEVEVERRALWMLSRGKKAESARALLSIAAEERSRPVERPAAPSVGRPQTIGKPQTIGESQTIGEPQTIGGLEPEDVEMEEEVTEEAP